MKHFAKLIAHLFSDRPDASHDGSSAGTLQDIRVDPTQMRYRQDALLWRELAA